MREPQLRVGTTVLGAELGNRPPLMDSDFSINQPSDLCQKSALFWASHQH